jgi:lipopolysaccharide export system permease protein
MQRLFARKTTQYIFFELIPPFILGLLVFIFILLMFQALRLTDFVLVHGVSLTVVAKIMGYLSISFLPALLPMSLLFAVIMTYGRLSADSEIVALKACGLHMFPILLPALLLSSLVAVFSAQTSFHLAPWGNRQFELIVTKVGQTKAGVSLKEGTFSEGFFDLVIYANSVNSKNGELEKVFIYDERQGDIPLTIISKRGKIIQDANSPGHSALLRLNDGDIHRKGENHTKIKFDSFDIRLFDPVQEGHREKTPLSMSLEEVQEKLKAPDLTSEQRATFLTEFHKRWAIALVCPLFGLVGVGLATSTNRRNQKSGGLIVSLGVIVLYWILYVSAEGMARSEQLAPAIAIWAPNALFSLLAFVTLKRNWN